jgi:hypothetical protein
VVSDTAAEGEVKKLEEYLEASQAMSRRQSRRCSPSAIN